MSDEATGNFARDQLRDNSGGSPEAARQLRSLIERIERLEEEKKAIAEDIAEVFAEAKAMGFDAGILRQVIRIRKQEPQERAEQEEILTLYLRALGMLPDEAGHADA